MSTIAAALTSSLIVVLFASRMCGGGGGQTTTPTGLVKPCDAFNACTDDGKACRPIEGVNLCVYVCPDSGGMAGAACGTDEFALNATDPNTCRCVPRNPAGRVCGSDGDCGYARDETAKETFLCSTVSGSGRCERVGVACRADGDCGGGLHCDGATHACVPCTTEVCDGLDNDCNGTADDIPAEFCSRNALGECAHGHTECRGGNRECIPDGPTPEICGDGRDNDCDGRTDLNTTKEVELGDATLTIDGGALGTSQNFLLGAADCGGGDRVSASFDLTGGDGNCYVFGWAWEECNKDPNASTGHSSILDVCKQLWAQGGDRGSRDCRYIAHGGNALWKKGTCRGAHRVTKPDCR